MRTPGTGRLHPRGSLGPVLYWIGPCRAWAIASTTAPSNQLPVQGNAAEVGTTSVQPDLLRHGTRSMSAMLTSPIQPSHIVSAPQRHRAVRRRAGAPALTPRRHRTGRPTSKPASTGQAALDAAGCGPIATMCVKHPERVTRLVRTTHLPMDRNTSAKPEQLEALVAQLESDAPWWDLEQPGCLQDVHAGSSRATPEHEQSLDHSARPVAGRRGRAHGADDDMTFTLAAGDDASSSSIAIVITQCPGGGPLAAGIPVRGTSRCRRAPRRRGARLAPRLVC